MNFLLKFNYFKKLLMIYDNHIFNIVYAWKKFNSKISIRETFRQWIVFLATMQFIYCILPLRKISNQPYFKISKQ